MNFAEGIEVTFVGAAVDATDGNLSGGSMTWSSSLDGVIGSGSTVAVSTLSLGNHVISLSAVDSAGYIGLAEISLVIVSAVVPSVHTGTISGVEVWTPQGNPHVITGALIIAGIAPDGASVTIQAGSIVKLDQNAFISVGPSGSPGVLIADGTAANPITFTAN